LAARRQPLLQSHLPRGQLIEDINEARELGAIRKLRAQFRAADLLLIDDLFLRKLPAQAGDELADVLMSRYEKGATIITSNRPLDDWPRLLGDVVVVTPLLDRLMHHGHLLKFEGKSWRLKEANRMRLHTIRTNPASFRSRFRVRL
jgi:DNA replication protein DnaC